MCAPGQVWHNMRDGAVKQRDIQQTSNFPLGGGQCAPFVYGFHVPLQLAVLIHPALIVVELVKAPLAHNP